MRVIVVEDILDIQLAAGVDQALHGMPYGNAAAGRHERGLFCLGGSAPRRNGPGGSLRVFFGRRGSERWSRGERNGKKEKQGKGGVKSLHCCQMKEQGTRFRTGAYARPEVAENGQDAVHDGFPVCCPVGAGSVSGRRCGVFGCIARGCRMGGEFFQFEADGGGLIVLTRMFQ